MKRVLRDVIDLDVYQSKDYFDEVMIKKHDLSSVFINILNKRNENKACYPLSSFLYYKSMCQENEKYSLYDIADLSNGEEKESFLKCLSMDYVKQPVYYKGIKYFNDELSREKWHEKKKSKGNIVAYDFLINVDDIDQLLLYYVNFWEDGYKVLCSSFEKTPFEIDFVRKSYEMNDIVSWFSEKMNNMLFVMPDNINSVIYQREKFEVKEAELNADGDVFAD